MKKRVEPSLFSRKNILHYGFLVFLFVWGNAFLLELLVLFFFGPNGCGDQDILGNCLAGIYFLLVYSIFLIPFIDGTIILLSLYKNKPHFSFLKKLAITLVLEVLIFFTTLFFAFLLVEFVWKFNIPFAGKGFS
jgi:hypothetical protein